MSERFLVTLDLPGDLARFRLPAGVQARLNELLDRQDAGTPLTAAERAEAEGLVEMVDTLAWLEHRAEQAAGTDGRDDLTLTPAQTRLIGTIPVFPPIAVPPLLTPLPALADNPLFDAWLEAVEKYRSDDPSDASSPDPGPPCESAPDPPERDDR